MIDDEFEVCAWKTLPVVGAGAGQLTSPTSRGAKKCKDNNIVFIFSLFTMSQIMFDIFCGGV
jgi:hypothetical protein